MIDNDQKIGIILFVIDFKREENLILREERHLRIMDVLHSEGFVKLDSLVDELGSSESTIRRDLADLEQQGLLRRVHGGAEHPRLLAKEETMQEKSIKQLKEKQAIAQKALTLIQEGETIFIDAGSTTAFLVESLVNKGVQVVTNSIHHAARLVELHVPTFMIGGKIKEATDACTGSISLEQIQSLSFDRAFVGMNGLDEEWFYTPDPEEAAIKRAILANATKPYILVDSAKFYQSSFVKVLPVQQVTLITNSSESPLLKRLEEKIEVIQA